MSLPFGHNLVNGVFSGKSFATIENHKAEANIARVAREEKASRKRKANDADGGGGKKRVKRG